MDAKPQRPRVLRVQNDENMLPSALQGKTLHQRTKSTPAFGTLLQAGAVKAANKKVLGEANANVKIVQPAKDDSAIGKKGALEKEGIAEFAKPVGTFARPATRPLAVKSVSSQTIPSATSAITQAIQKQQLTESAIAPQEPGKKVTTKKSTKILRDAPAQPAVEGTIPTDTSHAEALPQAKPRSSVVAAGPLPETVRLPDALLLQLQQKICRTETVPLRDEPATKMPLRPFSLSTNYPVSNTYLADIANNDHMLLLEQQAQALRLASGTAPAHAAFPPVHKGQVEPQYQQYIDEHDQYYFDEEGYTTARSFGIAGESTGGVTTVLMPKYTDNVKAEIAAAKMWVDATRSPEDVEDEQWDTSMVAEYGDEIFEYMRELETRMSPNPHYMDQQQEIQWSMRSVLIDWVVQVHQRFNLLPETLFLTVNYIDRFLSCKIVSLGKLQLVGATAIFVASKYEEVNCPTIAEIIYMVDGGYTADELLKAERFMLSMLQFELGWPGPMSFLRRISKADDYDLETRTLAKYFLEVTIMDERFVGCTPSFVAAGAHCMARLMLQKGDWSPAHVYYSNYTYAQLRTLLATMLECCENPQKSHCAVFDKYTDKRYKRASTFVAGEMAKGFCLQPRASSSGLDNAAYWTKQFY